MQLRPQQRRLTQGRFVTRSVQNKVSKEEAVSSRTRHWVLLFKVLVGVACTCGFLFQAVGVVLYFRGYPALVSTIFAHDTAEFPAVTLCLSSWYNITKVCDYFPKNCSKNDIVFFTTHPKFLDSIDMRRYGYPDIDKLFTCRMSSHVEDCDPFDCRSSIKIQFLRTPGKMCFTLDVAVLPRDHVFLKCKTPWMYELNLEATWDKNQFLNTHHSTTHPMILHTSQRHMPGKLESVVLIDGLLYEISIQQSVTVRLPEPYATRCVEYDARGNLEQYFGYETQSVCFQKCLIEVEMEKCGCAFYTREFSPSFSSKICSLTQMNDCIAKIKDSDVYDHCETACDLACKETEYDARLAGFSKYQDLNETTGKIGLQLSFATSAVEVFLYEPAMKAEEVFGYVGSYQEIWLGVSMVSIVFYIAQMCRNLLARPDGGFRAMFRKLEPRRRKTKVIAISVNNP